MLFDAAYDYLYFCITSDLHSPNNLLQALQCFGRTGQATIGIKRIGELDMKSLASGCSKKLSTEYAEVAATILYPFMVIVERDGRDLFTISVTHFTFSNSSL
jgi:predicted AlkP superfamily phosphohydrolase/phosphomutase